MSRTLLFIALVLALCTSAHAQLVLVETGGTFRGDATNIAAASNGATAIGQDEYGAGVHFITGINNGSYGNSSSWIGENEQPSWVGVIFSAPSTVASFAFGRDNTGGFGDRAGGQYFIEYTTDAVTPGTAASATWTLAAFLNHAHVPPPLPSFRHLYDFDVALTGVTAFRISTSAGQAIDELEVYSTPAAIPEPSTYAALIGAAALGFVAWRRRRTA